MEASKTVDFLLFNSREDRREAIETAKLLRKNGYTVARDIIRRDIAASLQYAEKMNILHMIIIGAEQCADDEVYVVRVADSMGIRVRKSDLFKKEFALSFGPLQGDKEWPT